MISRQASYSLFLSGLFAVALVSGSGCGSKDKKVPTTPGTTTSQASDNAALPDEDGSGQNLDPSARLGEAIYFEFDSNDLTAEAKATLEENAEWLREDSARTLTIEGHTDEQGTPAYNLGLGERRAATAKEYLMRLGAEPNRVKIITYGEERPAASDDALNRRSMFVTSKN